MRQRTSMLMSSLPVQVQSAVQPVKARSELSQTAAIGSTKLDVRSIENRTPIKTITKKINKIKYIYIYIRNIFIRMLNKI